jgi:hypothetical protein
MNFIRTFAATAALALLSSTPAQAATVMFGLTSGGTNTGSGNGNVRTFTATSGSTTVKVRATGWSATQSGSGYTIANAILGQYGSGLGVTARSGDGGTNFHTFDNKNTYDFVLLQFDQMVELETAQFVKFQLQGNTYTDNDSTISFGNTLTPWTSAINMALPANANALLSSRYGIGTVGAASFGDTTNVAINPLDKKGNVWIIGGAFANPDSKYDAFKLRNLKVSTVRAVPEPASWAMMLSGFGFIGGALRRKSSLVPVAA